jgi:membrane protease YdiL (CAAX protease family)
MRITEGDWDKLRAFEPIDPFWRYVLIASIFDVIPDIVILLSVTLLLHVLGVNFDALRSYGPRSFSFVSTVILAPLFETFILAGFIEILSKYVRRPLTVTVVSAACWGIVHALRSPISFFGVTAGFFVNSYSYLTWRKRSFARSYAVAFIPHAVNNLIALVLVTALV